MDIGLVCDSCSTFNPMGASQCARCQGPLSLDGHPGEGAVAPTPVATAQHAAVGQVCAVCNAQVPVGNRFCGGCGSPMQAAAPAAAGAAWSGVDMPPEPTMPKAVAPPKSRGGGGKKTMFFGAMQAARAKLVLIKGDGLDGVSFTLAGSDHVAGRVDAPLLFDEDPFLSPTHANFFYRTGDLIVRDEDSVNGVYTRIRGATTIKMGDRFLVGEQLLEIQPTLSDDEIKPLVDGTYYFASPQRPARFRIVQQLRGGDTGLAYRAQTDVVCLGREGNDINFPDDPFISGHHAQVASSGGSLTLTDLESKNGTFLRIRNEHKLSHGDYVFMGQQLLRVEIV